MNIKAFGSITKTMHSEKAHERTKDGKNVQNGRQRKRENVKAAAATTTTTATWKAAKSTAKYNETYE